MKSPTLSNLLALWVSLSLLASTAIAQGEADTAPSVTVTALKGPLHLVQGRGGNVVASVGGDGILMVDNDYAAYAQAYQDALIELKGNSADQAKPRFVLNTHWHGDHTGNNGFWGERGAIIVAHDNVRARMSTRQDMKALGQVVPASPAIALPVVTFENSLALAFNDDDIEVVHFSRGHTDGDSVVFFTGQNVVHLGDHFFRDAFPFVDLGSGGSVAGYTANIASLLARVDDQTVIVPGHGAIADKADLQRYYDMLVRTQKIVSAALAEGLSVDQITERGLGSEWTSWGQGFIQEPMWIATIAADSGQ